MNERESIKVLIGEDGVGARVSINRTTLLSRMKKLSIHAKQYC